MFSKIIKTLKDLLGHLNYSGDHCYRLASVVVHCAEFVMLCPLTSSQKLLGQSLLNFICRVFNVRRQEMIDFMTPPNRGSFATSGHKSFVVKMQYFFINFLVYFDNFLPLMNYTENVISRQSMNHVSCFFTGLFLFLWCSLTNTYLAVRI